MEKADNFVVKLIREHGVFGLGGSDGCACTSFSLGGVNVDIACRKSGSSGPRGGVLIRVESPRLDVRGDALEAIAKASADSLREGYSDEVRVRYATEDQDGKCACIYCGKPRKYADGYLCETCATADNSFGDPIRKTHGFVYLWHGEPEKLDA